MSHRADIHKSRDRRDSEKGDHSRRTEIALNRPLRHDREKDSRDQHAGDRVFADRERELRKSPAEPLPEAHKKRGLLLIQKKLLRFLLIGRSVVKLFPREAVCDHSDQKRPQETGQYVDGRDLLPEETIGQNDRDRIDHRR